MTLELEPLASWDACVNSLSFCNGARLRIAFGDLEPDGIADSSFESPFCAMAMARNADCVKAEMDR
jgi:hypothetical protein